MDSRKRDRRRRRKRDRRRSRSYSSSTNSRSYSRHRSPDYKRRYRNKHEKKKSFYGKPSLNVVAQGIDMFISQEDLKKATKQFHPISIEIQKPPLNDIALFKFSRLRDAIDFVEYDEKPGTFLLKEKILFLDYFNEGEELSMYTQSINRVKKQDWICSNCHFNNFARRDECRQCQSSRETSTLSLNPLQKPLSLTKRYGSGYDLDEDSFLYGFYSREVIAVRGIEPNTEKDMLRYTFAPFAPVKTVVIFNENPKTGTETTAFVEFESTEDARIVLRKARKEPFLVNNIPVRVMAAKNVEKDFKQDSSSGNKGENGDLMVKYPLSGDENEKNVENEKKRKERSLSCDRNLIQNLNRKAEWESQNLNLFDSKTQQQQQQQNQGFVYDPNSGFYYDQNSGYYYDPQTQIYCHKETHVFYKWDSVKNAYEEVKSGQKQEEKRVESEKDVEEKKGEVNSQNESSTKDKDTIKNSDNKQPNTENKLEKLDKSKTKGVLKFSIDTKKSAEFLKWNKAHLNTKKRLKRKTPILRPKLDQPNVVDNKPNQKDNKKENNNNNTDKSVMTKLSVPKDKKDFLNFNLKACLLCRRKFKSTELLQKHAKDSELHKKNIQIFNIKKATREQLMPHSKTGHNKVTLNNKFVKMTICLIFLKIPNVSLIILLLIIYKRPKTSILTGKVNKTMNYLPTNNQTSFDVISSSDQQLMRRDEIYRSNAKQRIHARFEEVKSSQNLDGEVDQSAENSKKYLNEMRKYNSNTCTDSSDTKRPLIK